MNFARNVGNAIRDYIGTLRAERGAERAFNWFGRLALVNFVGFCALTFYFGGDAFNGHEIDGRYFLKMSNRAPVEVSADVFRFAYGYGVVLFAHIAAVISIGFVRSRSSSTSKPLTTR